MASAALPLRAVLLALLLALSSPRGALGQLDSVNVATGPAVRWQRARAAAAAAALRRGAAPSNSNLSTKTPLVATGRLSALSRALCLRAGSAGARRGTGGFAAAGACARRARRGGRQLAASRSCC